MEEGLSQHEEAQFKRWLAEDIAHRDAFLEAEIAWGRLATIAYDRPDACDALSAANDSDGPDWDRYSKTASAFSSAGIRAIAASVAIMLVLGGMLLTGTLPEWTTGDEPQRYQLASSETQKKVAKLPDGTRITLEPGTQLVAVYSETSRSLTLSAGEASFKVATDLERPFLVQTGAATITVTGTWFDTKLRDQGVEVRVREGSVDVGPPINERANKKSDGAISLVAGERIWTEDGIKVTRLEGKFGAESQTISVQQTPLTAFEPEQLTYREAPLSQVVADINRFARKPVKLDPSASHLTLSGRFKSDEVEGMIVTIEEALPVRVVDENGERLIVIE